MMQSGTAVEIKSGLIGTLKFVILTVYSSCTILDVAQCFPCYSGYRIQCHHAEIPLCLHIFFDPIPSNKHLEVFICVPGAFLHVTSPLQSNSLLTATVEEKPQEYIKNTNECDLKILVLMDFIPTLRFNI